MAVDPFDFLESRDDADELIEEFGASVSVRRTVASGPAYDPVLTPTDYGTFATKVEFTLKQIRQGNILDSDERWLIAAGPLAALGVSEIRPNDKVVVGSTVHTVLVAKPLAPAGTVVMFDCQIRD
jgi:hypothetical protein